MDIVLTQQEVREKLRTIVDKNLRTHVKEIAYMALYSGNETMNVSIPYSLWEVVEKETKRVEKLKEKATKPKTAADYTRERAWMHNSFLGHCAMAMTNMRSIALSTSATEAAKKSAQLILAELQTLHTALKERNDG